MWNDAWFLSLSETEKLTWLYLLSNPQTNICGVYELPLAITAAQIGVDTDEIQRIFNKFEDDGKIIYEAGWVAITNFIKYQTLNPKVKKGIEIGLSEAPKQILDRLSIDYDSLSHSNSNLNSNSNSNSNPKREITTRTPGDLAKDFFERGDTYTTLLEELSKQAPHAFIAQEFGKFIDYWTEPSRSGKQQRWEQQSTFEVKRRLKNWLRRAAGDMRDKQTKSSKYQVSI